MMRLLSKTRILSWRQCPKRLWLELHRKDLLDTSDAVQTRFEVGRGVGELARDLFDPARRGVLIQSNPAEEGYSPAAERTREAMAKGRPVFEAAFCTDRAVAFADVMLPVKRRGKTTWRLIEVKSSGEVKAYHRDDAAVQAHIARRNNVQLAGVAIA